MSNDKDIGAPLEGLTYSDGRIYLSKGRKLARRVKVHGMDISIETDKGQLRHWYDPHNDEKGSTKMKYPYGYIRRTVGADDEHIDVYLGPDLEQETLYIIHQNKAPDFDKYDEDKVMMGFQSAKDAKQAYLQHYNSPKFFESMDTMSVSEFKERYVKKSMDQAPPADPMGQMMPMFNEYDMNVPQAVQAQLSKISTAGDKELVKLAQAVWGEGYEYRPVSPNQVRAELRGFLQDQIEWLQLNPMLAQVPEQVPMPNEMPHSSDSSHMYGPGANALEDQSNAQNSVGSVSEEERQTSSSNGEYSQK